MFDQKEQCYKAHNDIKDSVAVGGRWLTKRMFETIIGGLTIY